MLIALLFAANSLYGQLTLNQEDSIARNLVPPADSVLLYIIRPTVFAWEMRMEQFCDSVLMGKAGPKCYLYTVLAPGTHLLTSHAEDIFDLVIKTEANHTYYVKLQVVKGEYSSRSVLILLKEEEGKQLLSKFKLDHSNTHMY